MLSEKRKADSGDEEYKPRKGALRRAAGGNTVR